MFNECQFNNMNLKTVFHRAKAKGKAKVKYSLKTVFHRAKTRA